MEKRTERHEVEFKADVQKIKQYLICIEGFVEKIKNELDAGVIRAGGNIPCRRNGDRRKNE